MALSTLHIILFYVIGLVLIYLEIYLPGGILGILGTISILASMGGTFQNFGPEKGLLFTIIELIGCIFFLIIGIKFLPRTKAGKKLILSAAMSTDEGYTSVNTALENLDGKIGVTVTHLRPAGVVKIDKHRYDVVTQGEYIENEAPIKVIQVEGNRVVVKAVNSNS